jgi:predicted PurR-regulated permease PerM
MFVEQTAQLISSLPNVYSASSTWLQGKFDVQIPEMNDLQKQLINEYGQNAAGQVLAIGAGLASFLFNASVVLLVSYYLAAAGPKFRATVCAFVTPTRQSEFLKLWEITQTKISDYINSRVVLSAISSAATYLFLEFAVQVPYALPLAVFTGVVSQFVPTIGTYIGGALPIVFALTNGEMYGALWILVFIIAYQQFENLWLSPKISSMALSLNPAVAFLVVLSFGAIFGALGAFLALPVAATIQAIGSTYLRRHELVDSELLRDPQRRQRTREGDVPQG